MDSIELNNLWGQIKAQLLDRLPETVRPWVQPLEVTGYDNWVLSVVTGQMMGRDILKRKYYNEIVDTVKSVTNNSASDFVIIFDESAAKKLKIENEKLNESNIRSLIRIDGAVLADQELNCFSFVLYYIKYIKIYYL